MTYKDYSTRIEYDDGILFGQITVIRGGVGFGAVKSLSGFGGETTKAVIAHSKTRERFRP